MLLVDDLYEKELKRERKRKVTLPMRIAPRTIAHIPPFPSSSLVAYTEMEVIPPSSLAKRGRRKRRRVTRLPRVRLQYVSGDDDACIPPPFLLSSSARVICARKLFCKRSGREKWVLHVRSCCGASVGSFVSFCACVLCTLVHGYVPPVSNLTPVI